MVEKVAAGLTEQIIKEKLISNEMKDWYIYAFLRIFEAIISAGTILILSILLDVFAPTLGFWIFFNMLRKKTGGFHCEKYWQCYLGTILIYLMIAKYEPIISSHIIVLYALLFISSVNIMLIGTVNHPNMGWNSEEVKVSKKIARYTLLLEVSIIISLMAIGFIQIYITYMSIAVILCALLLCTAKITGQEVRSDDETKEGKKNTVKGYSKGGREGIIS